MTSVMGTITRDVKGSVEEMKKAVQNLSEEAGRSAQKRMHSVEKTQTETPQIVKKFSEDQQALTEEIRTMTEKADRVEQNSGLPDDFASEVSNLLYTMLKCDPKFIFVIRKVGQCKKTVESSKNLLTSFGRYRRARSSRNRTRAL